MTRDLGDFVEELGVHFDRAGLSPMAGRVLGRLLVCEPREQSAADLERALGASRGSISATTSLLIKLRMIERVRLPGDRKHYYAVRDGVWSRMMHDQVEQVRQIRQLADRGIGILGAVDGPQARLREMRDFYAFWEREIPLLIDRWQQENGNRAGETATPNIP